MPIHPRPHDRVRPHRSLVLGLALALAWAVPATAGDFDRSGFYVGGGVTYASDLYENQIEDAFDFPVNVDVDDSWGFNFRAGGRFLKFLAAEVQYEWVDQYDVKFESFGTAKVEQQTVTANLKLYLPFWRIQPYALAGVGAQRFEIDARFLNGAFRAHDDDIALAGRLGGGFDVYLTRNVVLYAEGSAVLSDEKIDVPSALGSDIDKLFYASGQAGLMWRF